ncbi:hypothetical protein E2562_012591 [Oryza meyeriana var. granulata]|uniref:Uncharacterized protein n=1 Tax=Oryza meyeriana var. granulata TaxID=110450 RepID=A0A6G1D310_9ORYZ|nr:hypothetical protein E2562_012591 [Oryza meyeriana var. granulata]
MGAVVKMLEGEMGVLPLVNPFLHLMVTPTLVPSPWVMTASSGNNASESIISQESDGIVSL